MGARQEFRMFIAILSIPLIVNITFEGEQRKAVVNMGKLGILDAVDAASGEYLFSMDMGLQNVVDAIDPDTGCPRPKEP
jgi:hypothetical protein